jgi:DNA-binding CsgD family transcriptional regulator
MGKRFGVGFALSGLLERHFAGSHPVARTAEDGLPRISLRGWRVIEEVSVGSETFLLLRRVQRRRGFAALTEREHDALRFAAAGASNKEVAYRMGIGASTVSVLLWRARRKVGAQDRDELIRMFVANEP